MTSQQDPAAWRLQEAGGERLMADPGIAEMVAQLHYERGTIRATVRVRRPRIVAPAVATGGARARARNRRTADLERH